MTDLGVTDLAIFQGLDLVAPRARWFGESSLNSNESLLDFKGHTRTRDGAAHVGLPNFRFAWRGQAFDGLGGYVAVVKGRK